MQTTTLRRPHIVTILHDDPGPDSGDSGDNGSTSGGG